MDRSGLENSLNLLSRFILLRKVLFFGNLANDDNIILSTKTFLMVDYSPRIGALPLGKREILLVRKKQLSI